jgi:CRISPR/Cas system-associated endonuclease Cas1
MGGNWGIIGYGLRVSRLHAKSPTQADLVLSIVEEFALEISQLVLQLIDQGNDPGCWTA